MRFQIVTRARMKMNIFWYVGSCSKANVYQSFRFAGCLNHQGDHCPNNGGRKIISQKTDIVRHRIMFQHLMKREIVQFIKK